MKPTHHHTPTRSFIIVIIVVLATVYTAFTLIKLQQMNQNNNPSDNIPRLTQTNLNTDGWENYIDHYYPLNILVPKDWKIEPDDSYTGFYTINFSAKDHGTVKIFISQDKFAGITNTSGLVYKTNDGVEVTKYDDLLYTAKVGGYYYTFDATLAIDVEKELSEMIRLAKFN
jgi:hypothetical protein